jgi:S-adenosylmethionine:tRNA ribosyltransferase-isomerase
MKLSDFSYTLPEELIALEPVPERTSSRILVLSRKDGSVKHKQFRNLTDFIKPGDALILNDTRVIPARLYGERPTGGRVEILLLQELIPGTWETLVRPSGRIKAGTEIKIGRTSGFSGTVIDEPQEGGIRKIEFSPAGKFLEMLAQHGEIPLPPYIKRKVRPEDTHQYQTVFAKHAGAVAAPTAGLHFDQGFLKNLEKSGVRLGWITLHVGYGTFKMLVEEDLRKHTLHEEFYRVTEDVIQLINSTRKSGNKVFVCGTTALRALESSKQPDGSFKASEGRTSIFIYPPYEITAADALITNFHLPRTSLMLLVSAFAGRENILKAYQSAVNEKYRFASYGDAMLIL